MTKSILPLVAVIACAIASSADAASTKPSSSTDKGTVYAMEAHSIGSGGISSNGNYTLQSTIGQWSVNVMKLSDTDGYELDSGIWPHLSRADCSSAKVSFSTDLSVCD